MSSVSVEEIADKVTALWKICRSVEVHQVGADPVDRCCFDRNSHFTISTSVDKYIYVLGICWIVYRTWKANQGWSR